MFFSGDVFVSVASTWTEPRRFLKGFETLIIHVWRVHVPDTRSFVSCRNLKLFSRIICPIHTNNTRLMKQGVTKWQSTNRYLYSGSGNFHTLDFIPAICLADKLNQLINEEENSFKPCLTKQPLNKFKLWFEWGIRFRTINTNNANLYFGATTSLPSHRHCVISLYSIRSTTTTAHKSALFQTRRTCLKSFPTLIEDYCAKMKLA